MNLSVNEKSENSNFEESRFCEEVFSKAVRAGKRTYFFDVKATRKNEYYLTITESKRLNIKGGIPSFEKHKIFLFREDFEAFSEGLVEILDYIRENQPVIPEEEYAEAESSFYNDFTQVDFEDLNK